MAMAVEKQQGILLVHDSAVSTRYRAMEARHREGQSPIPTNTVAKANSNELFSFWYFGTSFLPHRCQK